MAEDDLLTPAEVSGIFRVSDRSLRRWRGRGVGPEWTRTGRQVRYRRGAIEAYLNQHGLPEVEIPGDGEPTEAVTA